MKEVWCCTAGMKTEVDWIYFLLHKAKRCQIHNHLFLIKVNTLLSPLTGCYTLKLSHNVQEAT